MRAYVGGWRTPSVCRMQNYMSTRDFQARRYGFMLTHRTTFCSPSQLRANHVRHLAFRIRVLDLPHHIYNQNTTVHSAFYSPSPLPSLSTATTMAARAPQHSATSLARYATARQPDVDLFNGSASRDYCNSFWGLGDSGPNIMFARMRGASKTTDELRNFWNERCVAAWQSIF